MDEERTHELKQKASEVISQSKGAAQQIKHDAIEIQKKAGDVISESSEQFAHTLDSVCERLRETAAESEQEHPVIGRYVRSAADSMEKLSNTLRHKDVDFFVRSTEDMARKQPGIFLGSAFTMGFALGRFFKGKSFQGMFPSQSATPEEHEVSVASESAGKPEIW